MSRFMPTLFFGILLFLSSIWAAPIAPNEYDVWDPTITSPVAGDIWLPGTTQTVTWSTWNMPAAQANSTGLLLLGYLENYSENLDTDSPLASGFPLAAGSVSFTVPADAEPRLNYIVVLFGDSGDASPTFIIV